MTVIYAGHRSKNQDCPNPAMWCQTILRNKQSRLYRTYSLVEPALLCVYNTEIKSEWFRFAVTICLDSVSDQIVLAEVLSKRHYVYLARIPFIP